MVTIKTADANDGSHGGRSDAAMVGLVMRRCDCGDHSNGIDARARRHSRSPSHRCSVSMKRAGFRLTGL